ncbi:MAG: low molecular weight phosphotyrosine protein phosphatase [Gammaproteobacteria bacterium]|nr:low molecular weight phosphotyrosine protein phosphatase [Gammaproteobacteria bacterium]
MSESPDVTVARRILFVCMGNVCRSPTVYGVFRDRLCAAGLLGEFDLDSAGTHGYHTGTAPDERSQAAARRRGFDISDLRARVVEVEDFAFYDLIFAMDDDNLEWLQAAAPEEHRHKLHLLLEFATGQAGRIVPDPYYGGPVGFERVLDIAEEASDALLLRLTKKAGPKDGPA